MTQRNQKLIHPKFQLKLIGTFFLLACISALFQVLLLNLSLQELAPRLGEGGEALLLLLSEVLQKNLLIAFAFLVPLMLIVGVLVTHRIAGPIYRMERHLEALARGENPGECRIRKSDEFQELCQRINDAQRALLAAKEAAGLQAPRKAA